MKSMKYILVLFLVVIANSVVSNVAVAEDNSGILGVSLEYCQNLKRNDLVVFELNKGVCRYLFRAARDAKRIAKKSDHKNFREELRNKRAKNQEF